MSRSEHGRKIPQYDIRECSIRVVKDLCEKYHGYGSASNTKTYAFAVYENGRPVAAYAWQPPPPGSAASVCPEAPYGVLALSRMVAVPKEERELNHVSKPLRRQMSVLIDRTRWPVLVTYSDEGQGHSGHVYKCSGWEKMSRAEANVYEDEHRKRHSTYSNGKSGERENIRKVGKTRIQRWEHWACERGSAAAFMHNAGWRREAVPGKVWRSGNQAYRYVRIDSKAIFPPDGWFVHPTAPGWFHNYKESLTEIQLRIRMKTYSVG